MCVQVVAWLVVVAGGVALRRAERSVLGPQAAPRSKRAWWGWFVPLANVVLPYHAYSDAAMYVGETEHRVRKAPVQLACWWTGLCLAVVVLGFADNGSALDRGYEGAVYLLSGALGVGSSVLGALAFREVAAASRRIVADRSRSAGPAS